MTDAITSFDNKLGDGYMYTNSNAALASQSDDGLQGAQKATTVDDDISPYKSDDKPGATLENDFMERPDSAASVYDCLGNMCDCCLLAVICCFDGPSFEGGSASAGGANENKTRRRKRGSNYYAMTDYEGVADDGPHSDDTFNWGQSESNHVETNDPGSWCGANNDAFGGGGGGGGGGDCGCGDGGGGGDCGGGGE